MKGFELRGVIPPLVTPMRSDGELNEGAIPAVVDHVIKGGVHAVFALGSQSESFALSFEEKRRVMEKVMEAVDGRVPVLVGVGMITTRETARMVKLARELGADAVTVMTPYFITPSQGELYDHFYSAAQEAGDTPVLLYNNPRRTHVSLDPDTVAKLAELDNVVGMKESSGDLMLTMRYIDATRGMDFSVFMGNDALLLAGLIIGAVGAVSASANVFPRLVVRIYEEARAGRIEEARELQYKLLKFRTAFETLGTFPAVVKEAMEMVGLPAGPPRLPVKPLEEGSRKTLESIVRELAEVEA